MNSNQKKIAIAAIGAIVLALAFYFLYWVKTPTYSIGLIKDAVEKHDVVSFQKRVDMDTLYSKVFDDFIIVSAKTSGQDISRDSLAFTFAQMFKPPIVNALKERTLEAVKGEDKTNTDKNTNSNIDQIRQQYEDILALQQVTVKDVSVLDTKENIANIAVKIHNKKYNKDYEIHVEMHKADDGYWTVKEITNFGDFLMQIASDQVAYDAATAQTE